MAQRAALRHQLSADACINAGTRLALEDPEDADSNAIFGAVKTYEELVSKGYAAEVAVVAASSIGVSKLTRR